MIQAWEVDRTSGLDECHEAGLKNVTDVARPDRDCSNNDVGTHMDSGSGTIGTLAGFSGGLIAALLTARFTSVRERRKRQLEFLEKQLGEFYSPLLALRAETKAEAHLREFITNKAGEAWGRLVQQTGGMKPAELRKLTDERKPDFDKVIDYNNNQALTVLLPAYRKMVALFRDNLWLADEDTKQYYPQLVTYVAGLDRVLGNTVPPEVVPEIATGEEELEPFYQHLQTRHDKLRDIIKSGC